MLPITIPIFHHNDNTSKLKEMGINYSLTDCDIRKITFYNICAVAIYIEEDKEYANIHTDGSEYVSPLSYEEVNKLIQSK